MYWLGCILKDSHCTLTAWDWKSIVGNIWSQQSWWRHQMETFSALLVLCDGNPPVTGGFPSQRVSDFDGTLLFIFDLCLNKRLSKQSTSLWFETPSRSLYCVNKAFYLRLEMKYPKISFAGSSSMSTNPSDILHRAWQNFRRIRKLQVMLWRRNILWHFYCRRLSGGRYVYVNGPPGFVNNENDISWQTYLFFIKITKPVKG